MSGGPNQQVEELQTIVTNAHTHLQQWQDYPPQPALKVDTRPVPRVDTTIPQQPTTGATETHSTSRLTGMPTTRQHSCRSSPSHLTATINLPAAPPALSTCSKVCIANEGQRRVSRLHQPTQASHGKTRQANTVAAKPNWQCLLRKVERDVEQTLVVMDQDSVKMMNYRQLPKHPKFSKAWSKSSTNEFGQLTNSVDRHIKNPTSTIQFIHDHKVPPKQQHNITYSSYVCLVRPEKDKPNCT